ncbi:endo-1,4-beta-xylanase [Neobacillus sp. DY30]|uniref:endo-1,4-beta-xylanase n=1 Tax=Neobacillus sp. DY30 TaxID=3047871 RepID=UPI0032E3862D
MRRKLKRFISLLLVAILIVPSSWMTQAAAAETNNDIPVLLYHRVVENPTNQWTDTSIEKFKRTMQYLNENGYTTLSAEQYVAIMEGTATAPEKPILLTFDDATPDFITNALPVLKQYNMNSVLFVVSDWIGGSYSMSTEQLQSLTNEPSVSLQNHSKTHEQTLVWNSDITLEEASQEISAANVYLKSITDKNPVLMAYPYGAYNSNAEAANRENGIKYAFKVGYPNSGNYAIGRHYVMMDTTLAQIASWIGGPAPAPVVQPGTETVFTETFANGMGVAVQAGNPQVTHVSGKVFAGNEDGKAISVSGRTNNWDGVDIPFSSVGMENGKTYSITVTGFVDSSVSVPAGAQALLQNVDSYKGLYVAADFLAGQAFTLTGKYTVDTSKDRALRIQSNDAGKNIPFYIGNILITTEKTTAPETDRVVFHETFGAGLGLASQAGSAKLTSVSEFVFEGNSDGKAISVNGRTNNWDGVDIPFSSVGMQNGNAYTITVTGFVDNSVSVPAGAQALLQNVDSYNGLYAAADFKAGQPFTLTGQYTVDTSKDRALRIQSNDAGKTVPFYIGDILITEKAASGGGGDEERPPAQALAPITFENQNEGGFEGRAGSETLTITNEANHTEGGSYALKVEGRSQAWHGPALRVEKYVDKDSEYKISAWVKLISPATSQLQLSTQVGNGGTASYNNLQGKTISTEDGWVKLEGTYRYSSVGDEFLTIYVESSNNSTASFYIDHVTFEPTGSGPIEVQDLTPIKDVYKNDFLIGNAVSASDFEGNRLKLLKMHHNVVSAENAMKPDQAYNENRQFDFTAEDTLVDKALVAGLKIHGHVLVWHQQSPEWLFSAANGAPLSREEALANLRNHVKTVVEHFGDKVISWDVVNEAIIDNPPNPSDWKASLRQSGWYKAIGPDFVEQAFLAAKEVVNEKGLNIKLYYNDYNDDNQSKAEAIYQMVKEINEKYADEHNGALLIDGIGMQAHYNKNTNPENVRLSLEKFISLGVEVSVTELDITAGTNNVLTEKEAIAQGYLYAQLFKIYKQHADHISRVTFWGLNDATSWRAAQSPLLFDKDLQAKPAYYAVINPEKFIAENQPEVREANQGSAVSGTPMIDGTVDGIWSKAAELPINRFQMAWQGANGVSKVLWDKENLYVLIQVSDSQLDKSSPNPWEQDSIEVFVDENNAKTSSYEDGDGQYRVNFDNETSFNPVRIGEGFESATKASGNGYTVEVKIPFKTITPDNNTKIGFDVQINDGKDGARQSAATWNDLTGLGYQDTSVFGVLTLIKIDTVSPVTTDNAPEDWVNKDVTVTFSANDDDSGVAATYYTVDNGAVQSGNSVTISDEGVHTLTYWSVDNAGNSEPVKTKTIKLDKTAPTLTIKLDKTILSPANQKMVPITAAINASDAYSGIHSVMLTSITSNETIQSDDIQNANYNKPISGTTDSFKLRAERLGNGNGRVYTITYTATDNAGNTVTKSVEVLVPRDNSKK